MKPKELDNTNVGAENVKDTTSRGTLNISIPKYLAHDAEIERGTKLKWSIEGKILSLRRAN